MSQQGISKVEDEEQIDIDLTDPEVSKAAVKIQAGFKGYQTRKGLKETGVCLYKYMCSNKDDSNRFSVVLCCLNPSDKIGCVWFQQLIQIGG